MVDRLEPDKSAPLAFRGGLAQALYQDRRGILRFHDLARRCLTFGERVRATDAPNRDQGSPLQDIDGVIVFFGFSPPTRVWHKNTRAITGISHVS
jgi:hypothetical protein